MVAMQAIATLWLPCSRSQLYGCHACGRNFMVAMQAVATLWLHAGGRNFLVAMQAIECDLNQGLISSYKLN